MTDPKTELESDTFIPTPGNPRIVTRELIYHYERNNLSKRGIGKKMLELGLWVISTPLTRWDATFPDPLVDDMYSTPRMFTRSHIVELIRDDPNFKAEADEMIAKEIWVVIDDPDVPPK